MKTAQEYEKEIIDGLKENTGKDLPAWLAEVKNSGHAKRNDILNWLKSDKGLKHGLANTIVAIHFNNGNPVYQSSDSLKDAQFEKREHLKPLYDALEKAIEGLGVEVNIIAKKMYMSFNGKREFAVAAIKSKEIRVGMDLGDQPFDDYVVKATSLGAMPRISHMVVLTDQSHIDDKLRGKLKEAYQHVHPG